MYQLYFAPDHASLIVRIALLELGQPFETIKVDTSAHEHKTQKYCQLNPQGLIPVLIADSQSEPIYETAAILLYLAMRHQQLMPVHASHQGVLLKWLFFISNTLHADLRIAFYHQRYQQQDKAGLELLSHVQVRVINHLQLCEQQMQHHAALISEDLSICDIYLAICMRWMLLYPKTSPIKQEVLKPFPRLLAWLQRLEQRPAFIEACKVEGIDGAFLTAPKLPEAL